VPNAACSDLSISGVATLEHAARDDVTFFSGSRHASDLAKTRAAACFLSGDEIDRLPPGCIGLVTTAPAAAYAEAALRLYRPWRHGSSDGDIHPSAELEDGVILAPGVLIGAHAAIGRGTRIGPGAIIGPGVCIGRDCQVGPRAVIGFALIGDRVQIYAGAVLGEPGFGAAPGRRGMVDLPQLGRVIIQDGVTVGANSCVDRGAFEDTVVGENTKIDNLVQIAHNVVIGRNCVLAAHTGISGSCVIGDGVMFGGRAGVGDHIHIGDGARLAAGCGVLKDVPAGETWAGLPARPLANWLRESAWVARAAKRRNQS